MTSANETFSFPKERLHHPSQLDHTALLNKEVYDKKDESFENNNDNTNNISQDKSSFAFESTKNSKTHKRGTESSLFNSDATLVDNISIPPRVSSTSSEVSSTSASTCPTNSDYQNVASLIISEEEMEAAFKNNSETATQRYFGSSIEDIYKTLPPTPTIDCTVSNASTPSSSQPADYFGQNLTSSNRGFSNRSMNLLGHRTSKSENFTLKLPKKPDPKSANQLDLLREETGKSSFIELSKNNTLVNFDKPLPTAPLISKNNLSYLNNSNSDYLNFSSLSPMPLDFKFSLNRKQNNSSMSASKSDSKVLSNNGSIPVRPTLKLKSKRLALPNNIKILKLENTESKILEWSSSIGSDDLPNLIIVDLRSFHDYCKSHITGAINICLPSTLLKRSTFTLQKCVRTLTHMEKDLFDAYLKRDKDELPTVLFYDDFNSTEENISSSIFHLASKFIESSSWSSELFILEGGFEKFNQKFKSSKPSIPKDTAHNHHHYPFSNTCLITEADMSTTSLNSETFSPPILASSPQSYMSPSSTLISKSRQLLSTPPSTMTHPSSSPICLSRFTLPEESTPMFKTKTYDEVISNVPDNSIHLSTQLTPSEVRTLPKWLGDVIGNDNGSHELTRKFNELQIEERTRLNHALTKINTANSNSTGNSPVISFGVELGNKNRYKDIFIYEHARVKLNEGSDNATNYINASYIKYPGTNLQYIATQGPLKDTIGDFWKMVHDNKVPIILSLTAQKENQVEKCAPFWEPGAFYTNFEKVVVELVEEVDDLELSAKKNTNKVICRRLTVQIGDKPKREVLQLHMVTWPDFGIVMCEEDILSLVSLKRYITTKLNNSDHPVLVHCSAGCGRTGSFCVIDTCVNILYDDNEMQNAGDVDLIYDITSMFRSQRVFMVQTLRQYMLIYDSIIKYIKMHEKSERFIQYDVLNDYGLVDWEIKNSGIVNRFLHSYDEIRKTEIEK